MINKIGLLCLDAVCRHYDISIATLVKKTRRAESSLPRQKLCWMLRKHAKMSYPAIARALGLHHTTVMNHFEKVDKNLPQYEIEERDELEALYWILATAEYDEAIPF